MGRAKQGVKATGGKRRGQETLAEIVVRNIRRMGFKESYVVGGAIRDELMGKDPKDVDVAVAKETFEAVLAKALKEGDAAALVVAGQNIGVRMRAPWGPNGEMIEVELALARTEVSTGASRHQFAITANEHVTIEEDLARRDLTRNAIARNINTGETIDPYNGAEDIKNGIIRTVTEKSFPEDPLRVLRALARASKDGAHFDDKTFAQMKEWADDPKRYMRGHVHELMQDHVLAMEERALQMGLALKAKGKDVAPALEELNNSPLIAALQEQGIWKHDGAPLDLDVLKKFSEDEIDEQRYRKAFEEVTGYRWYGEVPLSPERVHDELKKILMGDGAADAMRIARDAGVLQLMVPELSDAVGYNQQSVFHDMTVDEHTLEVLARAVEHNAPWTVRLAALTHDSGKPASAWGWAVVDGVETPMPADKWNALPDSAKLPEDKHLHFYGSPPVKDEQGNHLIAPGRSHEDIGEENARRLMNRLSADTETTKKVVLLVREHMYRDDDEFTSLPPAAQARRARRFLQRVGEDNYEELMLLRRCDRGGKRTKPVEGWDKDINAFETAVRHQKEIGAAFQIKDLAVDGRQLAKAGFKGVEIGAVHRRMLDIVVEEPELNTVDGLMEKAETLREEVRAEAAAILEQHRIEKARRAEVARAASLAENAARKAAEQAA